MKGIILAGGIGSRLYPATTCISKQLIPIYDKPMIYYPLTTLMLAGIQNILIISTPRDLPPFQDLLGDGAKWGLNLSYVAQPSPAGLAQSFILGEKFVGADDVCLVLGDNIFYGHGLTNLLQVAKDNVGDYATIFGYYVNDPERYGVIEFDDNENVIDIVEKPQQPKSNYAVTGLYFYGNSVIEIAKSLKPSKRGELEITDVNKIYLQQNKLKVVKMHRGFAWLDTGTHKSLLDASYYFYVLEQRQGLKVACPEEIAWRMGFISAEEFEQLISECANSTYGQYLQKVLDEK